MVKDPYKAARQQTFRNKDPYKAASAQNLQQTLDPYKYLKLIHFAKNEETGRTRGAPNKSVPNEDKIGLSSIPFTF